MIFVSGYTLEKVNSEYTWSKLQLGLQANPDGFCFFNLTLNLTNRMLGALVVLRVATVDWHVVIYTYSQGLRQVGLTLSLIFLWINSKSNTVINEFYGK